ncbi:inositol monophosphatase [candidate division KSB1 bacterium]|nr:inositol monophosphatase [candidate division KSB1 bacterium]
MLLTSMNFLETARKAAHAGGAILISSLNTIQASSIKTKQQSDYVTHVDLASEKAIIEIITAAFPDHIIMAEETGQTKAVSEYRWIIDPLDGTTNYIHGYPVSAVSIALERGGEIILGVVYDPFRDEMFWAEKGSGSFLNDRKITVSSASNLEPCLIATGFPFKKKHALDVYLKAFSNIFQHVSGMRRAGAAAIDLAYVACGRFDGFWESLLKPWDMAAGTIIVREAGGKITDFNNTDKFFETQTVVATNGYIHNALLALIQDAYQ